MKKNYIIKAIAAALVLAFVLNIAACSNSAISADDTSSLEQSDVASVESDDDENDEEIELTAATFDAVEASSYANWDGTFGYPEWAFDGDTATAWQDGIQTTTSTADKYGVGEWLKLYNSEGDTGYLNSVTVCNGYQDDSGNTSSKDYYELNSRVKGFSLTFDDGTSVEFELEDTKDAQTFSFEAVETASVTFTILSVYEGQWSDTCIAEISYNLNGETIATALEDSSAESDTADDTTTTSTTSSNVAKNTTLLTNSAITTTKKSTTTTTTTKQSGTAVTIDLGNGETTTIYVTYYQDKAYSMLSMINEWRTTDGGVWYYAYKDAGVVYAENLQAWTWDSALEKEAKLRAAEAAYMLATTGSLTHTRPNGTRDSVYATVLAENLGCGPSASSMFTTWKEENCNYSGQGHRRVMLSSTATKVGIACAYYNGRYYWAMETGY